MRFRAATESTPATSKRRTSSGGTSGAPLRNPLARPVFAEAGDLLALEDEDGDLAHPLAYALRDVVEARLPLHDRGVAVEVETQHIALDVGLRLDHLRLPVGADALAGADRGLEHALVIGGGLGEDR